MKTEAENPAPDDVVSIFSHPYSVFLGKSEYRMEPGKQNRRTRNSLIKTGQERVDAFF